MVLQLIGGEKMKAYVLSTENGTVQIGHAVYCIQTEPGSALAQ